MRRTAAVVTGLVSLLASMASALPAQAAGATPASISAACTGSTLTETALAVSGYQGDTITLSVTGTVDVQFIRNGSNPVTWAGSVAQTLTPGSSLVATIGSTSGSFYIDGRSPCNGQTHTVTVTVIPGANPNSGASAGDAPAPVVQEFGLPASGTCDAAASKDLNWAGVASGGWAVSWGQWMNGGKGGAVCTRTLVYSTAQATWTVAA